MKKIIKQPIIPVDMLQADQVAWRGLYHVFGNTQDINWKRDYAQMMLSKYVSNQSRQKISQWVNEQLVEEV